jgi:hypothetical protein
VKRDDLIDHAIHLYRSGFKVTKIAQICYVNRRTIHRWIKQSGAKRNDYHKRHQDKELAIRAKAEKERTMVDKINSYRHNMLWEMLIQFLPNAEVKNVTEMIKLSKFLTEDLENLKNSPNQNNSIHTLYQKGLFE